MTQQFTQKYAIVQFFENIEEGYEYPSYNWPLHATIIDTFAINWSVDDMTARLSDALRGHAAVSSVAGEDTLFGDAGQTRVVLLERSDELSKLHRVVLSVLEEGGVELNDPQFARDGFLPHATVQKHARLNNGNEVRFTALSIIDMFPDEDPYRRKVLKTIRIGH